MDERLPVCRSNILITVRMVTLELYEYTAAELGQMLLRKHCSPREIAESVLDRIKKQDIGIGAYITVNERQLLQQAEHAEVLRREKGEDFPLAGIPVGLKDNIRAAGMPATCASRVLLGYRPEDDADVVKKLKKAGCMITGKLNMDEFAMGSSGDTSFFGQTRNPVSLEYTPGGSSGGCAAAVAADEATIALGTDTGGSIRQPAAFCGVVGLKPTHGSISPAGIFPLAPSMDQAGPLAKSVMDAALLFDAVKNDGMPLAKTLEGGIKGITVGLPAEYFGDNVDAGVKACVLDAAAELEKSGAHIAEISLPLTLQAYSTYFTVSCVEIARSLLKTVKAEAGIHTDSDILEKLNAKARHRIEYGNSLLRESKGMGQYRQALETRKKIAAEFERAFKCCDILLTPSTPSTAYKIGNEGERPLDTRFEDALTTPANLAGLPALSVPCGYKQGLPVGMQLIGRKFDEKKLLNAGLAFERLHDMQTVLRDR